MSKKPFHATVPLSGSMQVCENLELAEKYSSNELEKKMLEEYRLSFLTGKLDHHKERHRRSERSRASFYQCFGSGFGIRFQIQEGKNDPHKSRK
jgi:hypothetical protein